MAATVLAVFVYRMLSLWLPMPFALASMPTLRAMGRSAGPRLADEADGRSAR